MLSLERLTAFHAMHKIYLQIIIPVNAQIVIPQVIGHWSHLTTQVLSTAHHVIQVTPLQDTFPGNARNVTPRQVGKEPHLIIPD